MSYGAGHRCSSDLALLWLWHRPEATAPVRPLAWEPPYAGGCSTKKTKANIYIKTLPLCIASSYFLELPALSTLYLFTSSFSFQHAFLK